MIKALTLYFFAAVSFAVLMHPAAHAQDQATIYYANAYADHYGVPRALVDAIIEQESAWNPLAQSVKDAEGLMQLMPATAALYGVRNRYDILENLSGGVRYLADLLREFHGDMRLAVAAYYCGSRHILQRGFSYSNPDVVAYVESVRRRYQSDLQSQADRMAYGPNGGN
ncbi:MAG: lytic transglycosylase domain-containing protein [Terriglobia bacterium]|nr:lytic transglycosylase domain-containing protein [Terriglobia bacterium]